MPKIVDHEAYRAELVDAAIPIFRAHGFHGLSVRRLASELGISKSALYHYFPSKQALFDACSERVTHPPITPLPPDASAEDRRAALLEIAQALEVDFQGELTLLLDYIRPLSTDERRADPTMDRALTAFRGTVASIVGPERAEATLAQLLGLLLMRLFDGGRTPFDSLGQPLESASIGQ